MSLLIQNIRTAFLELGSEVSRALQTQVGDAARLREHKRRCLQFLEHVGPVCSCASAHSDNTDQCQAFTQLLHQ
jgi:hypothetical protein